MIKRIAVVGPESSGKTTLAKALAEKFYFHYVEEYARSYFSDKDYSTCSLHDLVEIAKVQHKNAHSVDFETSIVSDTEMLTVEIWAEDKYSNVPSKIIELRKQQQYDLYILCTPDIPWQADPLRLDSHRRDYLFECYKQALTKYDMPYIEVSGSLFERINRVSAELL